MKGRKTMEERSKKLSAEEKLGAEEKQKYTSPMVKALDISQALMVAASKSGMGSCKITFI